MASNNFRSFKRPGGSQQTLPSTVLQPLPPQMMRCLQKNLYNISLFILYRLGLPFYTNSSSDLHIPSKNIKNITNSIFPLYDIVSSGVNKDRNSSDFIKFVL